MYQSGFCPCGSIIKSQKQKTHHMKNYLSPSTEIVEILVEQVIAASPIVDSNGLELDLKNFGEETEW